MKMEYRPSLYMPPTKEFSSSKTVCCSYLLKSYSSVLLLAAVIYIFFHFFGEISLSSKLSITISKSNFSNVQHIRIGKVHLHIKCTTNTHDTHILSHFSSGITKNACSAGLSLSKTQYFFIKLQKNLIPLMHCQIQKMYNNCLHTTQKYL